MERACAQAQNTKDKSLAKPEPWLSITLGTLLDDDAKRELTKELFIDLNNLNRTYWVCLGHQ